MSVPGSSTVQNTNMFNGYSLIFNQGNYPIRYSTLQRAHHGNISVFTTYLYNHQLYVSNATITSSGGTTSAESAVDLTSVINPSSFINDYNYFISNNSQFVMFSTSFNDTQYLTITDLANNKTFTNKGSSIYSLGKIFSLGNSSDVYFSFYNKTTFSIVKYNFTSNLFSVSFNSTNFSNNSNPIFSVYEFTLDDQIYVSVSYQNFSNPIIENSSIYILDNKGIIFNQSVLGLNINTFTTFENGLLLYSMNSNMYYRYYFGNTQYYSFDPQIGTIHSTAFYPFDNDSYLILNPNNIITLKMNPGATSFLITQSYDLLQNPSSIQAFNLGIDQYYLLSGLNSYNQFEILLQNINTPPTGFNIRSTTTSSNSYYPTSQYYQTVSSYSYSSNPSSSGGILVLIVISFVIVAIVVVSKKIKSDRHDPPRNDSYLTRNQYFSQLNNQRTFIIKNSFCSNCGSPVFPEDIFCQNCGHRI